MVDFTVPVYEKLASWNQNAPREYISACLCFPYDNVHPRSGVMQHLQAAVSRLQKKQPTIASEIHLDRQSGMLYLAYNPPNCFETESSVVTVEERPVDSLGDDFPRAYQELRGLQWPPGFFLDKHRVLGLGDLDSFPRARAFRLQVTFLEDGLLLWMHLHHSIGDAACLSAVLVSIAAETCGVHDSLSPPMTPFQPAKLTASIAPDISWPDLVTSCPELGLFPENTLFDRVATPLPRLNPPTPAARPYTSAIFVIKVDVLKNIGEMIRLVSHVDAPPSVFVVLSALTWAYITRARYKHEVAYTMATPEVATLGLIMQWRQHALQEEAAPYFGNASADVITRVPRDVLLRIPGHPSTPGGLPAWVPAVTKSIQMACKHVVEPFVAVRTAMMDKAVREGRVLGRTTSPIYAGDLEMDSWRNLGAHARWGIPGVGVAEADRVRIVAGNVGGGKGALVLPAKHDAKYLELLVTLAEGSMKKLTACREWMILVDRVIRANGQT
ncbi:conserved hypothetical protein [Verticillium alfalfae VaMs.102]|uniref:Trichothecene 3-O-acetyltransferase n=1 Tax=Verticillium alfalfae (strain VaMs.102 / ATCC MYA-4576 / FGSC 10136) TaxID=526221 RepID=C9SUD4_VERA1|nr:conserved hypothetical protein [Verticillium alfalfae VaMs.102]EEY22445.1 conserved hypothetical protein [Verticillium alfalfae VaMs.102]